MAWGQKGGLAQLGSDDHYDKHTASVWARGRHKVAKRLKSGAHMASEGAHVVNGVLHQGAHAISAGMEHLVADAEMVGGMAIDKIHTLEMPTKADVKQFLKDALKVKDIASKIKTKNLNIANIAGQFLSKKMAPVGDIVSLLMIAIPGATEISNITQMVADGASGAGNILERFNTPDDGTKKTCWIKSKTRKFTFDKNCAAPKVRGLNRICYDPCPAG